VLSVTVPVTTGLRPAKLKAVRALAVEAVGVVAEAAGVEEVGLEQPTTNKVMSRNGIKDFMGTPDQDAIG
jgi:hypothetical protein